MALLILRAFDYQLRNPHWTVRIDVDWRRSWTWSILPVEPLAGIPLVSQVSDLPPTGPLQPLRSWTWTYNPNLIAQDRLPTGKQVYDLAPLGYQPPGLTWINQNLLVSTLRPTGLPPGEQVYNLPPIGYPPVVPTWSFSNPNLFPPPGPDTTHELRAPHFTPPRAPDPPGPTWAWWFNLNLQAPPGLPPGEQVYTLPPQPYPPSGPTWAWSYNLNLIGQDKLPTGAQSTALTPQSAEYPNALRTWIQNLRESTLQPLPYGAKIYALPPTGYDYTPPRSWVWYFNRNLTGQDLLPTGKQVYDLPPTGYLYPNENRTWIQSVNLALIVQAATLPFNQYDWPNPKLPQQPTQIWTSSYNQNLIGKDVFPPGGRVYDLPPIAPPYYEPNRGWANFASRALYAPVAQLPHNQYDWPLPQIAQQPTQIWTFRSQFLVPIPPTPPPPAQTFRPYVRDWWDSDEWGNIYPGSGIRRG